MKDNSLEIEARLKNMKNFYSKASDLLDNLPDNIPEKIKNMLKDTVLGDEELKNLMDGIDTYRPPRILLIGRTGVGKSSFINALCGSYIAAVSDTESCTSNAQIYKYKDGDRVLMEILDTRGIAESQPLDEDISAEEALINDIKYFTPDVAIFMLSCTRRDDIVSDIKFLKKVSNEYSDINKLNLPIIAVVNKCDEMAPPRIKVGAEYTEAKINNINKVVKHYKEIIIKNGLKIVDIVPISSLIDWKTADDIEVSADEIAILPEKDLQGISICFDGRYNIDELRDVMEEAIVDFEAKMGLKMAFRLNEVVKRMANQLNKIFSNISAVVALSPIPVSDIYILLIIQALLVCFIAALSGRNITLDTAKEFILSMGGILGAGFSLKLLAQQASKLLNVFYPGAGSLVSGTIAKMGTSAIGKAAISYYIDDKSLEEAKKLFELAKKEKEEE